MGREDAGAERGARRRGPQPRGGALPLSAPCRLLLFFFHLFCCCKGLSTRLTSTTLLKQRLGFSRPFYSQKRRCRQSRPFSTPRACRCTWMASSNAAHPLLVRRCTTPIKWCQISIRCGGRLQTQQITVMAGRVLETQVHAHRLHQGFKKMEIAKTLALLLNKPRGTHTSLIIFAALRSFCSISKFRHQ